MINRAIDTLLDAQRVDFYALGHYGVVAQDAQFKFLRFGLPSMAYTDARLQMLAAAVLKPKDVVIVISASGKLPELLEAVDKAKSRGAEVIAITASQSPLARRADVALIIDYPEDVTTHLPMVTRILHLLVIDILAVGVAMRRQVLDEDGLLATSNGEGVVEVGEADAANSSPLSKLTSHSR
jgi:glucokinase